MTRVINKYVDDNELAKKAKVEITGDDMREGLTCVAEREGARAQVQQPDQGQAGHQRSRGPVEDLSAKLLTDWLRGAPDRRQDHRAARSSRPLAPAKPRARPAT